MNKFTEKFWRGMLIASVVVGIVCGLATMDLTTGINWLLITLLIGTPIAMAINIYAVNKE